LAYPYGSDRDEVLSRLRKIEGQVRGVHRMVEEDTACTEVLTQVAAVISGMEKVGLRLLRDHMQTTLSGGAKTKAKPDERIDEIVKAVERFLQA